MDREVVRTLDESPVERARIATNRRDSEPLLCSTDPRLRRDTLIEGLHGDVTAHVIIDRGGQAYKVGQLFRIGLFRVFSPIYRRCT